MKKFPFIQKLRQFLSSYSSLLLLFQRTPVVQMFFPQANLLASSAALNSSSFVIASVVGLGAYDSVAGATTVTQLSPNINSSIVSVTAGAPVNTVFRITGTVESNPASWTVTGTLPTGLSLAPSSDTTASITGTTAQIGNFSIVIKAWESAGGTGASVSGNFTVQVAPGAAAAITGHPASTTINSGSSTTLSVTATGGAPLVYHWFEGPSGTTTTPVGTDSNSFTTPVLTQTTSYWVKVTNSTNPSGANSNTATVTVRQPAAITTHPAPATIISGQNTTLSVVASGDAPLTYTWYEGDSGVTTKTVGTNSASFTTPALTATTKYWVKVTNIANATGANSNAATVTVQQPAAITTNPASIAINIGQSTTLSVEASGDAPLSYQWYQGASGVTTTPVGTNSASFTTPVLNNTTSYWVKVTNDVLPAGVNSTIAVVTVLLVTPPYAHAMSENAGLITPSTRGDAGTTWFGWDTFNEPGTRAQPIDDSSPDIGTTLVGANFQTTSSEDHVLDNGEFSFTSGTLAEQITVPTDGTVGPDGFTTLVLQIAAPPGAGAFAGPITLGSINGVAPTVVQDLNSGGDGQVWAKWELPGNDASYTLSISGSPGQGNFNFDSVVVDTFYSETAYMPDSVAAMPPTLTTASPLPIGVIDVAYNEQLAGTGGTAPYQFAVSVGSLPAGLSLSSDGLLSGTPTAAVASQFTVQIIDENILIGTKVFNLTVTTAPVISTASPLTTGLVGVAYSKTLAVSGGTAPYTWTHSGGTLPAGVDLSTAGVLSGTPTAAATSNFTVQVQDANGLTDTETYSVTMSDLTIVTTTLPTAVKNVAYNFSLTGINGSPPYTWETIGDPPVGISLSGAGVFTGTPTGSVGATFTVRLTDSTNFFVTKQLTLPVSATFLAPIIQPINFPTVPIGAEFTYTVTALNYPKNFVITGLPKGLKFVAATGVISGRPDVSGAFNVQVRASNAGGVGPTVTARLTVKALDKNLVGTFGGLIARDPLINRDLGGTLTVTTTSKGSYSVKLIGASGGGAASASYAATGRLAASAPQISVPMGGKTLTLTLNPTNGQMTGTVGGTGGAIVSGWRAAWNAVANPAETLQGYYSMALDLKDVISQSMIGIPQGTGFATFSVNLAGSLTIVGKAADGEAITSSSFLGANGDFWLYGSLYKNQGTMQGALTLSEDANGLFVGNTISGSPTWFKPDTVTRTYADGFGPVNLTAQGAYLAPANKGNVVEGLPDAGSVQLRFTDGGLANADPDTDPDMDFTYTDDNKVVLPTLPGSNRGKVALTINAATGAVAGNFTLVEKSPPLTRAKVAFQGQVVRMSDSTVKAVGNFLLPQIPDLGQAAAKAPILSGGFSLQQPVP